MTRAEDEPLDTVESDVKVVDPDALSADDGKLMMLLLLLLADTLTEPVTDPVTDTESDVMMLDGELEPVTDAEPEVVMLPETGGAEAEVVISD